MRGVFIHVCALLFLLLLQGLSPARAGTGASQIGAPPADVETEVVPDDNETWERLARYERRWREESAGGVLGANADDGVDARNVELVGRRAEGTPNDMVARGNVLYLAEGGLVKIIDFSGRLRPREIGKVLVPSVATAVALEGCHLFVVDEVGGLRVIDVRDPTKAVEVGSCDFTSRRRSSSWSSSFSIDVSGNKVYVGDPSVLGSDARLHIIDVSDPRNPSEVGGISIEAKDISVCGDYIYVASSYDGLVVIDAADPADCRVIGRYRPNGFSAHNISVEGQCAYLAGDDGIVVVDISHPTAPAPIGQFFHEYAYDIEVRGDYAYVVDTYFSGLAIFDVSNPAAPVEVSRSRELRGWHISVADDLAFVLGDWYPPRVLAVDISNPIDPRALGRFEADSSPTAVAKAGEFVYIAGAGLTILDARDPAAVVEKGKCTTSGGASSVAVRDGTAYVGGGSEFRVLDVSDPGRPVELGGISLSYPLGEGDQEVVDILDMVVNGQYVYLLGEDEGDLQMGGQLRVIDVSSPTAPRSIGRTGLGVCTYGECASGSGIAYHEGLVLVASGDPAVLIYDVSDPSKPKWVGSWGSDTGASAIAISGGLAYVGAHAGISVLDLKDPANPNEIGRCDTPWSPARLEVIGGYLHVACNSGGYRVLDVSDPTHPAEVAFYDQGVLAKGLAVDSDRAYVVATGGLYIFSFVPTVAARVDIEPGECPNVIRIPGGKVDSHDKKGEVGGGLITVAIYGTPTLPVKQVDPISLRLEGCQPEAHYQLRDVGRPTPAPGFDAGCAEGPPDGEIDLVVRFRRADIFSRVGDIYDGLKRELTLTGTLFDGRRMIGADSVMIVVSREKNDPTLKWAKRFGDGERQHVESVAVDGEENVLVTGYFRGTLDFGGGPLVNFGPDDAFVAKLDRHGRHVWSRSYCDTRMNDPAGKAVAADDSGNVFFAGEFGGRICLGGDTLSGPEDQSKIFLAKFDPSGNHLWSRKIGWLGSQSVAGIAIDHYGGVVLAGSSYDYGSSHVDYALLTRFDADGGQTWYRPLSGSGDAGATDVAVDGADNIVLTGWLKGSADFGGRTLTSVSSNDIVVAKFDSDGRHVWGQNFRDGHYGKANSVAVDREGNIVVLGEFSGEIDFGGGPIRSHGQRDIFLVKFGSHGHFLWGKGIGGAEDDGATDVAVDQTGCLFTTGYFYGAIDFGAGTLYSTGGSDIFVATFDRSGIAIWSKSYGGSGYGYWQGGPCITVDDLGQPIVGGNFSGSVDFGSGPLVSEGETDIFLAKLGSVNAPAVTRAPVIAEEPLGYSLQLHQNYPNPFNPSTTIPLEIPERALVTVTVFDVAGRLTRTLLNEVVDAGRREVMWDGRDSKGNQVSSGLYFTRLAVGRQILTKKMVCLK